MKALVNLHNYCHLIKEPIYVLCFRQVNWFPSFPFVPHMDL